MAPNKSHATQDLYFAPTQPFIDLDLARPPASAYKLHVKSYSFWLCLTLELTSLSSSYQLVNKLETSKQINLTSKLSE